MKESSTCVIHDPCFLRVLIALNRWESSDENEFQPASCRELFHLIAESILDNAHGPKYQTLKFLSDRLTDRAMRQRVREFEMRGLITTMLNPANTRAKQLIASDQFIALLNRHVKLQRQACERYIHLIDKTSQP